MRIALVTTRLEVGGLETILKSFACFLKDTGHSVDFIETSYKGRWSDHFRELGLNVITIAQRGLTSGVRHVKRIASVLQDYDVIFLNDVPQATGALGLLPAQTAVIPILHLDIPSFIRNATSNSREWDLIVAVSPGLRDTLLRYTGISPDRVICIPNGVEVADTWPKAGPDLLCDRPLRVVYVGRVENQQKGVMHLPGIVRRACDLGCELEVNVVGDGPDLQEVQDQFAARCSDCRVRFHGAVGHLETLELMAQQDVLLMPSYFEGLPIALLEAMARGVVPVVSRLPGQTDVVVTDAQDGFLRDVGNEEGFAKAVHLVYRDRNLWSTLSRCAWQTIAERFNLTSVGNAYLAAIEDIRGRKKAGRIDRRSGRLEESLLGDLPHLPACMVRPVRKLLRVLRCWPPAPVNSSPSGAGFGLQPRPGDCRR